MNHKINYYTYITIIKHKLKTIIIFTTFSILLFGCKNNNTQKRDSIFTTIEPQKYFLEKISNETLDINCIVSSGSNPENFDIAPSQLMTIENSKAFFKVGFFSIENILIDKIKENNPNLIIIDCSKGIIPQNEAHIHDHEGECNHGSHANGDPHIWTSPKTARQMIDNMLDGLIMIDSTKAKFYTENYNNLVKEINQTDSIIKEFISKSPSKSFIIYHPSLSYFAQEYGLEQLTIEHDGKQPTPIQLKEIIDRAKASNVKVVFIQQEFDTKNAETIAKEIDADILQINQLSYNWSDEMIKIAKAIAQSKNE